MPQLSNASGPLHVGILHYTCPPVVGGVERLMAIHASLLSEHGHRVTIIAGRGGRHLPRARVEQLGELDSKHPSVLALNAGLELGEVPPDFEAAVVLLEARLRPLLDELDACIVHNALSLHFNLPLTAALHHLAGQVRARLIAWCHDLSWSNPLYIPLMRDRYPWSLLKFAAPAVRYVVVSEDRRQDLAALTGLAGEEIVVVPAGIDPARAWKLQPATVRLLDQLELWDADPLLLLPARITKRKNIELAIRIVAELVRRGMAPRLLVTGPPGPHNVRSGDYVWDLLQERRALRVEKEVLFVFEQRDARGRSIRISDAMMDDLYLAADMLIFPSSQEGFGIPMLEAGIARLPIFAADIPALRETAGRDAHFFALDADPSRVAEEIATYLDRSQEYRLRKRTIREYTWKNIYRSKIGPLLEGGPIR